MNSLSKKITVYIGVILAISFIFSGFYLWMESREEINAMATEQAEAIAAALDASIGKADHLQETAKIQNMIERMVNEDNSVIEEITIHDAQKNYAVTACTTTEEIGAKADPEDIKVGKKDQPVLLNIKKGGQSYIDVTLPLHEGKKVIGSAGIMINMQAADEKTLAIVKANVITMGLAWIFSMLILSGIVVKLIVSPVKELGGLAEKVADGDLTAQDMQVNGNDEIADLVVSFNKMKNNLKNIIDQQVQMVSSLSSSAQQLNSQVQYISETANSNSATTEEVAATVEQLAENAKGVSQLAGNVATNANNGINSIEMVNGQMKSIITSSDTAVQVINDLSTTLEEVNQIVELIAGITDQTNMLALNASIEAASAGEHGRGFAVVADEVKKLSEQSGDAANRINQLIEDIKLKSEKAVETMQQGNKDVKDGGAAISEINDNFNDIIQVVNGLTDQVQNMAAAVGQIPIGINNVAESSKEQTAAMESVADAAQQLTDMSVEMNNVIDEFKI